MNMCQKSGLSPPANLLNARFARRWTISFSSLTLFSRLRFLYFYFISFYISLRLCSNEKSKHYFPVKCFVAGKSLLIHSTFFVLVFFFLLFSCKTDFYRVSRNNTEANVHISHLAIGDYVCMFSCVSHMFHEFHSSFFLRLEIFDFLQLCTSFWHFYLFKSEFFMPAQFIRHNSTKHQRQQQASKKKNKNKKHKIHLSHSSPTLGRSLMLNRALVWSHRPQR